VAFLQTVADRVARRQMPPGLEAVDAALDTYAEATVAGAGAGADATDER